MKIINVEGVAADYGSDYDECELEEYELKNVRALGVDVLVYWYGTGFYEGAGYLLMRHEGKWHLHDGGHCSCYGPTEEISLSDPDDSLDALEARLSDDLKRWVMPLITKARKRGYKP